MIRNITSAYLRSCRLYCIYNKTFNDHCNYITWYKTVNAAAHLQVLLQYLDVAMRGSTSYFLSNIFKCCPHELLFFCGNSWWYIWLYFPGNANICPECGSDHVVQLAGQPAPHCSTPIRRPSRPDSEDDCLDMTQSTHNANKVSLIRIKSFLLSVLPFISNLCITRLNFLFMFSLIHNRMITQMPVSAVVLFWKRQPLHKIPPLSRLREAPSSSRRVRAIPAASPTTQTAKVKRIWLGVTTTPPLMVHHLKSSSNLQKEPPPMVGICSCVKCQKTV